MAYAGIVSDLPGTPWYILGTGPLPPVLSPHALGLSLRLTAPLGPPQSLPLCHRLMTNYVTFVVGEILLLLLTICSLAAIFPRVRTAVCGQHPLSG